MLRAMVPLESVTGEEDCSQPILSKGKETATIAAQNCRLAMPHSDHVCFEIIVPFQHELFLAILNYIVKSARFLRGSALG